MGLKRQRSDSDISTSSSLLSSPPSCSSFTAMDGFQSPQHQRQLRLLFPSRTRKRHRDNRPSEFDVHRMLHPTTSGSQINYLHRTHSISPIFCPENTTAATAIALPVPNAVSRCSSPHQPPTESTVEPTHILEDPIYATIISIEQFLFLFSPEHRDHVRDLPIIELRRLRCLAEPGKWRLNGRGYGYKHGWRKSRMHNL